MKQVKKLSQPMYNLLIINNLNDFTVTYARDELQKSEYAFSDSIEARKYIYRQVLRLELTGFLKASGQKRRKIYQKTNLFSQYHFHAKPLKLVTSLPKLEKKSVRQESVNRDALLENECNEIQANLAVSLAEVEEYKLLMGRFPEVRSLLAPVFTKEKERSVVLLAKLNTRTYLLKALKSQKGVKC